jgi:CheY-like chemotaxis protein
VAEGLMAPYEMMIDLCESGRRSIEFVKSKSYDIIFMDHMMPEMNGIDATLAIRELGSPEFENVPIIALTANAVSGMKEMFLSNGFNDFLSKPIEMKKLNEILEKWIPADKKEKYIVKPMEKSTEDPIFEIEGLSVKYGILMAGESLNNYLKILTVFYKDGEQKIREIKECCENDIDLYVTHVHALKSALGSIGANDLSEIAKSLENAGKGEDTAFIRNNNDKFLEKLDILLNNIKQALSKENATEGAESENSALLESLKESLTGLKEALNNMDTIETDRIINNLTDCPFSNNTKETLGQIAQHILLCDYDEAINKIDALIKSCAS